MTDKDQEQNMTSNSEDTPRYSGPLHSLFLEKLPETYHNERVKGRKQIDVAKLAGDLNLVRQTVYVWFWKDYIDSQHVRSLVQLPGSKLVEADFLPFIFKD